MFQEYEIQDTSKHFVHVLGWQVTISEMPRLITKIAKVTSLFYKDIAFFYVPCFPSTITGHTGCNVNLTCAPKVHKQVYDLVSMMDF